MPFNPSLFVKTLSVHQAPDLILLLSFLIPQLGGVPSSLPTPQICGPPLGQRWTQPACPPPLPTLAHGPRDVPTLTCSLLSLKRLGGPKCVGSRGGQTCPEPRL